MHGSAPHARSIEREEKVAHKGADSLCKTANDRALELFENMQSFKLADDIEMYGLDDSFEADAMAEKFFRSRSRHWSP